MRAHLLKVPCRKAAAWQVEVHSLEPRAAGMPTPAEPAAPFALLAEFKSGRCDGRLVPPRSLGVCRGQ